jgi:hypothetical protein
MASPSSADGPGHASRRNTWSWLLPAGTFVAGCALGAVVMAAGNVGDIAGDDDTTPPDAVAAAEDSASDESTGGGPTEDSGLYVRVPDSCVQTAEGATALVEQVDRVVAAVADVEPEQLRQTVDDVQQVRDAVQDVAEQCREAAAQRLEEAGEADVPATPAS